jgi:hypothetical protein
VRRLNEEVQILLRNVDNTRRTTSPRSAKDWVGQRVCGVWKDGCMPHQVASRAHGAHCSWALDPGSGGMSVDRNTTIAHANLPTYERSTILSPGEWGCETPTNAILVVRDAGRLPCSINSNSLKSNFNKVTMHLHLGIRQYNLNQRVTCSQLFPQSPQE